MTTIIRVMLVDDQELFRAGLRVIIDAQPDLTVVAEAANGAEAIRINRTHQPDVILMDVRMPYMDGVVAAQNILSEEAAHTPKILMLTTFAFDEAARAAMQHGASGFLLKDASPAFLCETIRVTYAGQRVVSASNLEPLLAHERQPSAAARRRYDTLTERERAVFHQIVDGKSNAEAAQALFLSESTVKTHLSSLMAKLGIRDRVNVVIFAYENALTIPRDPGQS